MTGLSYIAAWRQTGGMIGRRSSANTIAKPSSGGGQKGRYRLHFLHLTFRFAA